MNNKNIDALLSSLSGKLNISENELRSAVQSGKLDNLLGGLNETQSQKINDILNNPEAQKKLFSTPQAQALLKKLMR